MHRERERERERDTLSSLYCTPASTRAYRSACARPKFVYGERARARMRNVHTRTRLFNSLVFKYHQVCLVFFWMHVMPTMIRTSSINVVGHNSKWWLTCSLVFTVLPRESKYLNVTPPSTAGIVESLRTCMISQILEKPLDVHFIFFCFLSLLCYDSL